MGVTSDPNDPRLTRGVDDSPVPQAEVYLVLSDEERAKGFVRPVRDRYIHVGPPGPRNPDWLRDLTPDEQERFGQYDYVKFEPYNDDDASSVVGRFWTQAQLAAIGGGCQSVTTMGLALAETYARDPSFYGATYCVRCQKHLPVGEHGEFVWEDGSKVGT